MPNFTIITGDCIESLSGLPDGSVHCCVTSPPYYGLRDYGVDGQIGLEETPQHYIARLVDVFREVRRVLRDDGTLWLNLGDSYAAQRGGTTPPAETLAGGKGGKARDGGNVNRGRKDGYNPTRNARAIGFKHKDRMMIPARVAIALQDDGWWLRDEIVWHKPNPMPSSVKDRTTPAHEMVYMLAKSARYFYDQDAVKEPAVSDHGSGNGFQRPARKTFQNADGSARGNSKQWNDVGGFRNPRSVWTITTKPFAEAHFATFPPDLIRPAIRAGCPAGGTVLDPFGGSGTTGVVAWQEGRNAILCELNPDYVAIAERRIARAKADGFQGDLL